MDILSARFHQPTRQIGIIVPSVVVKEEHKDELKMTEHPVEKGAVVNDHAYKLPAEVTLECGFAGGGALLNFADTTAIGLSLGLSPKETYQQLLKLQASRQPFDVITGKRVYKNMLLKAMTVTTDAQKENVLMAVLKLQEVIISQTKTDNVPPKEEMKYGVSTAPVQNTGTKTTQPVKNSILTEITGRITQ